MTPAARISAAIAILDRILQGEPAEPALLRWARGSRFAGSGDRAAVRDLVFDSLRRLRSRAAWGGGMSGRAIMIGACREHGEDPARLFTGEGHAPPPLSAAEIAAGHPPDGHDALDLPNWLLPLWRASLGDRADPVALLMRDRAPVWLRANPLRGTAEELRGRLAEDGIEVLPHPDLPTALQVTAGQRQVAASRAWREGWIELQDLSPQLACEALPPKGSVLDYCAGGGGKALAMAARGAGPITAHDVDFNRMKDLPERAARAGVRIARAQPGQVGGTYDLVIADVPCSGSGSWRRSPDAKWRLTRGDLDRLRATQAGILRRAADFVASGGHLAYMTCSLLAGENRDQIDGFLQSHPGFSRIRCHDYTPLRESDGFHLSLLRRD